MDQVTIYTDGACSGNPGPGGWAAILISGKQEKELCGHDPQTTNNRMELTAAIEALRALKRPCQATIYSDSNYVIRCFTEGWMNAWKSRGWKRMERKGKREVLKPVLNVELWQELDRLMQIHRVTWEKVKGHAGDEYNERVDRLAVEQAQLAKEMARQQR
jgi:ribonuclease HI